MLTIDQTQSPMPYGDSTSKPTSLIMNASVSLPVHKHIWIVTGPAGSGKTTVAKHLADFYAFDYIEGDDYHPPQNIAKMAAGTPLTDADRWDWLISIREASQIKLRTGTPGVVLTCSALKRKYRDVIRVASYNDQKVLVHFIYLQTDEETILQRVRARKGHYMKDDMVRSQFASLEEPKEDEKGLDVFCVDASGNIDDVGERATAVVKQVLANDTLVASS
ncbi:glucokinase [Pseudovirgaria hyperparasitica]|uniref:Gluconokinase n=1 Tax=Pseudovirgaria hyperparasitica TaxID=470096 RepID=A0A6A6WIN2_9PEZI|nr:glucokinase [Pseudovirgaria hyperparasitica]KAF2761557.1 glucokinase [Pseudovirgaria hyperparasitica]